MLFTGHFDQNAIKHFAHDPSFTEMLPLGRDVVEVAICQHCRYEVHELTEALHLKRLFEYFGKSTQVNVIEVSLHKSEVTKTTTCLTPRVKSYEAEC